MSLQIKNFTQCLVCYSNYFKNFISPYHILLILVLSTSNECQSIDKIYKWVKKNILFRISNHQSLQIKNFPRALFAILIFLQWNSRTFLASRTEPNRIEPNRTESNRIEPNRTESNRTEPNSVELIRFCHGEPYPNFYLFFDFFCVFLLKVLFGSIEPNRT